MNHVNDHANVNTWQKTGKSISRFEHGNEEQSAKEQSQTSYVHFFTIPLKFSYALGISPLYVKPCSDQDSKNISEQFQVATWLPQKTIYGILTLLDLIYMLGIVRGSFPRHHKNPAEHLMFVIEVISHLYKCVTFKILWTNQSEFAELVNFIHITTCFLKQMEMATG